MRLEIAEFPVSEIRLGTQFGYDSGKLLVDSNAIVDSVLREKRIEAAWLDVVAPGDHTRVTGIRDVVEPRIKVSGSGQVFPGVLGPVEPVGDGRTHRLSGMAVFVDGAVPTTGLRTKLSPNAEIYFAPAIAGGTDR